ncbi:long-chain fatty acid transport protein 4 [Tetranychus urticae]|uniref:Very long-chain fatty acid transport protein n=1 Tax=Tetranychus urticae TaxID=32264 RepID=T1JXE2_TETUR|nr:long-chain fatty acid transport protein 4 [Tetranychus urticae]XP_015795362.1 long-chain fatty acid transport protein 4 [Tetranychus urticae]XP_025018647.1 long-chain fatty acid transport protein 4 [Tetranychus urticae]
MLLYALQERLVKTLNNSLTRAVSNVTFSIIGLYAAFKLAMWLRVIILTIHRDLRGLYYLTKTKVTMALHRRRNMTVAKLFKKTVAEHGDKPIFYHQDEVWSFKQLDAFSNKVANIFTELGFNHGDEVVLFMESKCEYIGLWLGLAKMGVVTALINTNQRKESLIHSILTINSKAVIFGTELTDAILEVYPTLKNQRDLKFFSYGNLSQPNFPHHDLNDLLKDASTADPININSGNYEDKILYIYTSGTTGLPKAAVIKNCRFIFVTIGIGNSMGFGSNEIIYTCIPLYHLSGGIIGSGQCLLKGNSMAIRHKFSAKNFWTDCIKYQCTSAQYIGEICRYLLCQPESPADRAHSVRSMFGNGLRINIWKDFVKRFNIERVLEFYGATEGNAHVVNVDHKAGACGFISQILPGALTDLFYPVSIIKVDEITGEPIRSSNGLCIRCRAGDSGEFVGKIVTNDPSRAFDGYANQEASDKKIIRNVFRRGDAYFASGDLVTLDELGYVFFKDRTGDTFRWKGENVSTTEVEAVIGNHLEHVDCVVYGVEIPGCEGRAGMAAILDPEDKVDLKDLLAEMKKVLPNYSIPVFVRKCQRFTQTGTFKLPKVTLRNQAYNPVTITDPLYYFDVKSCQYLSLDEKIYQQIMSGLLRF